MEKRHYDLLWVLRGCTFLPGSWDKRFVRHLSALPVEAELTEKQVACLEKMAHRYLEQMILVLPSGYRLVVEPASVKIVKN